MCVKVRIQRASRAERERERERERENGRRVPTRSRVGQSAKKSDVEREREREREGKEVRGTHRPRLVRGSPEDLIRAFDLLEFIAPHKKYTTKKELHRDAAHCPHIYTSIVARLPEKQLRRAIPQC